jgi:hypothetical protein
MRFRSLLLAAVALLPSIALGQATIQLSGSKLLDNNGNPLAAGKIVLTVTDASGTPVTYTPQGGSPTTATYTDTVVKGAVQYVGGFPFQLLNTLTASPSGLVFHYQLESTDGSIVYLDVPKWNITSTTGGYSLDSLNVLAGWSITGLGYPRTRCSPTAKYTPSDNPAGAKPWICSTLWRSDNTNQWTQNPSANPNCQMGQAIVSPQSGPTYCILPENAYALPGEGFTNPSTTLPGPIQIDPLASGANLPHTLDLIAGDNNGNGLAVPEMQNVLVGGVSTVACAEDHNKGLWDVRCRGWATNPSTALVNTIHDAMCYDFINGGPNPVIQLPAGPYSIGGNILIPPNVDVEGVGGTNFGFLTQLTTNDTSQPMFTQVGTMTFTCNGVPHVDSGAGGTLGNVSLFGGGTAANTDVGLVNAAGSDYIHNISFTNFGGSCRARSGASNGINSRGSYIFFQSCLQWYYYGGSYNTSGFTDTAVHGSLQLDDQDSSWDQIYGSGQLADGGFYNRFLLTNVQLGGGPGTRLTNSFIQLAPHNVWVEPDSNGSYLIEGNHFDGAWWSSLELGENGTYSNNIINGYCISPTLNPANFPTNPGGVSTDPNCSGIELEQEALGSILQNNNIGESGAVWPAWPIGSIFATTNITGTIPTTINQPGNNTIIGQIGGNPGNGNPGADVSQSMHDISWRLNGNVGTTLHFKFYKHLILSDTVATSYSTLDGLYPDAFVTLQVGSHDTVTPSATIVTCGNANIVGPLGPIWFTYDGAVLTEFACL